MSHSSAIDYPKLSDFLTSHRAVLSWRAPLPHLEGGPTDSWVEGWMVDGTSFLITLHGEYGWDIWMNLPTNSISETLEGLERRLAEEPS